MAYPTTEGISQFVQLTIENVMAGEDLADYMIVITGGFGEPIDIVAKPRGMVEAGDNALEFPEYKDDDIEFTVALTALINDKVNRLAQSSGGRKSSSNMTASERSERARRAAAARVAKYGRKTAEERRAYQREWARKNRERDKE